MANRILNDPAAGNNAAAHVAQARPDAGDVDVWAAGWQRTGVLSGCAVTASGGMAVTVAPGVVAVADEKVEVAGDDVLVGTGGPRTDLVVVSDTGVVSVVAGVSAARPAWPTIPADSVVLATVYVEPAMSVLSASEILDKRVLLAPKGTRLTTSVTTASLTNTSLEQTTISIATGFRLLSITTDRPARVRVYDRAAKQTADASRVLGVATPLDAGLILEYVSTAEALTATLSPEVDGHSMEVVPTSAIPITITNLGSTGTVTVGFSYVVTE